MNVWDSFEDNRAVGIVDEVIKEFFEQEPPRFLEVPFGQIDVDTGRTLYESVGLRDIQVAKVKAAIEVSSHDLPARGFITGTPTILEIGQRATVDAENVVAAAASALEDKFGPAPVHLDFQATVFVGSKPER